MTRSPAGGRRSRLLLEFVADRRPECADDLEADFDDAAALIERLSDTRGDPRPPASRGALLVRSRAARDR